ncbi:MAG: hypothetical protein AAGI52_02765 [Bacteroidota bacterium]
MRALPLLFALLLVSGCGLLGGAADLTAIEVAGRYAFTEYEIQPTAESLRDLDLLGDEVSDDLTLFLSESGEARLERLRGDRVDETYGTGTYDIRGRTIRLTLRSVGDLDEVLMPRVIEFEGDGSRLSANVFLEGVNLEDVSNDYSGITRADVRLQVSLREIN